MSFMSVFEYLFVHYETTIFGFTVSNHKGDSVLSMPLLKKDRHVGSILQEQRYLGCCWHLIWITAHYQTGCLVTLVSMKHSQPQNEMLSSLLTTPGGLGVKALNMNHDVRVSGPTRDFCCMSFPTSVSTHFTSSLCC